MDDFRHRQHAPLMWFFGFMYWAEGMCQVTHINGLLHQPLAFYFKDAWHWNAGQTAAFVSMIVFPWSLKPLFGLLSDFVPLFGYRRKSYLLLVNVLASIAFFVLAFLAVPGYMLIALAITTVAMTASSTLSGALLVENGKTMDMTSRFQAQQGLWFGIASCVSCIAGGLLCSYLSPSGAFHTAAALSALAPLVVAIVCWPLIKEEKTRPDWKQFKATAGAIGRALKSKALWTVALFLALWSFNPGFGHPLMFFMRGDLKFSPELIGYLNAIYAAGSAFGAVFFIKVVARRLPPKTMVFVSVAGGVAAQAAFIFISNPYDAAVLHFINGVTTSLALLTMHVLAANACPDKAEGFVYAAVLAIANLSWNISQTVGGYVYVHWFNHQLKPLILLSAGSTLACLMLVPFFRFSSSRTAAPVKEPVAA